jgi:hypothetical protein
VHKFKDSTPDWLYQTPALDANALPLIQKELLKLSLVTKDNLVPYSSTFVIYGMHPEQRKNIFDRCPVLIQELLRLKLLGSLSYIGLISVDANKEFPPHIDTLDVGLNIPLYNCDNTYTVWYDAEILDQPLPDYAIGSSFVETARIVDPKNAVEIGRVEANQPWWINTNIPHRPETHHDQLRLAASIRFLPEPLDEYGNLWPHLIKINN